MSSSIIGTSILTLPLSIDASKITTGTIDTARIDADSVLNATTSANTIPAASAQKILSQANRTLTAGNGLTGGGTLAADRTFTLGTPGTITISTTNSVTATSHTHAFTLPTTQGAIGTYCFLAISNTAVIEGNTYSGSSLFPAGLERDGTLTDADSGVGIGLTRGPGAETGSWRAMGRNNRRPGDPSQGTGTLFLRIS